MPCVRGHGGLTAVIAIATLVSACSHAVQPAVLEDAQLVVRVRTALVNDPELGVYPIEITARLGEVTLTGKVARKAQQQRVIDLVSSVPGVSRVIATLDVDPTVDTAPSPPSSFSRDTSEEKLEEADRLRPGWLAVGGSISWGLPRRDDLESSFGIGPLVRLGSGQGLGLGVGFSWFKVHVGGDGLEGRPGTLRIRPLMAGLSYTARRGRSSASLSLLGGWAINSVSLDTDEAPPTFVVSISDSLVARAGASVWVELSRRTAFNTFVGYIITRPSVTFYEAGSFETNVLPADAALISAGVVYKLF